MATRALKLEDFGAQKLSKNQQKTVRGGEDLTNPPSTPQEADPGRKPGTGGGGAS